MRGCRECRTRVDVEGYRFGGRRGIIACTLAVAIVTLTLSAATVGATGPRWLANLDSRRVSVVLITGTSRVVPLPRATSLNCRPGMGSSTHCSPRAAVKCHAVPAQRSILASSRVFYSCSNDLTTSSAGQGRYLLYEQLQDRRFTVRWASATSRLRVCRRKRLCASPEFVRLSRATVLKSIASAPAGFWEALNKRLRITSTIYLDSLTANLPRLVTCTPQQSPFRCTAVKQGQVLRSGSMIYQLERNVVPPIHKTATITAAFARVDAVENLAAFGRAPTISEKRLLVVLLAPISAR